MKYLEHIFSKIYIKSFPRRISSSLSDNQAYPQVCLNACNDYRKFNNFRKDPIYKQILEHVSEQQGSDYLEIIRSYPDIITRINDFKENDRWGNPATFYYQHIGEISPSTLRYIKVLADLKSYFISLDNFDICEIGVGYGGQCRIINAYYKPATYTLVDIQPALSLSQRYLDNYIIKSTLTYQTMNELDKNDYDLVISNYAFSELPRAIQDVYLEKIILNSKRGYITYNEITPSEFKSYKSSGLVNIIPNSKTIPEVPLTHPNNCVIICSSVRHVS